MSLSLEQASQGSFAFAKAGLAIGTTTTQISTANTVQYCIDGVFATAKAAVASVALAAPTGFALSAIAIGNKAAFAVWLDSAGTLTVTQGPSSPYTAVTDKVGPPPNPGSRACIGVFTVAATTAIFTPGTTVLGTGNTVAYTDLFALPGGAIA